MVSRIGDELYLPDDQVRSEAAGRNDLARMLAGKSRLLAELATGESAVAGEPGQTKPNPQNLLGVDLSGPPWGSALRHPLAWRSWGKTKSTVQAVSPPSTSLLASGVTNPVSLSPFVIWVRPHSKLPPGFFAPYSRGYVTYRAHRSAGAISTDLEVKAWNVTLGETAGDAMSDVDTFGALAANESTVESAVFVNLRPGINSIRLQFFCQTAGHTIVIDSVQLEQRAKRSH